ncbi:MULTISPECIES: phosphate ABC transporter permease subunit PstC [Treponema]|uniref:Phosphate transport system permease protein n=1 Tax=Treponema succinifaciens (strain ATCC 33096 / DSM 2489 / 6091) TaxID=869209 RepID=F2NW38_TRES6|nr:MULTISPECIES: phosphate ABC transporter permease subunit PstC [Treponema]AEB14893.1 phosphate ABC transporter, inner membrane subunit PstC [Treponema succinifaciens DSM 2489]MDD6962641.1 phosphate ABC transporter permease subunit PstC [Treponema succinifaciens]MDY5117402.1 phosphate ABC transporter permease subunit PstC [Treponema succinifaciens]
MKNKYIEQTMRFVFLAAACVSIAATITICIFLFANGVPAMLKIGLKNFIFGLKWKPSIDLYGIFPMIVGSITVTLGALILGVPLGLFTAVFLARYCPKQLYNFFESGVKLLAGIPSVVYGFFGLTVIVPAIRNIFGGNGTSILAASIVLAIMILPTIISVSESSIRAVPSLYFEGSLALGACKERSIFLVELKAAKSGIMAGIILGVGRAVGETMAVIMVAGNQAILPRSLVKGIRTLTANIVLEMGYAADLHRDALIATSVILFIFILIINLCFSLLKEKKE